MEIKKVQSLMTHLSKHIKKYVCIICLLFITQLIIAQEETYSIPDSLSEKTYDYLFGKAQEIYQTDSITSLIYIKTYLAKAIYEDDSKKKVNGYNLLSYYTKKKDVKFFFIEKSLLEIENINDINKIYPYVYIGTVYHDYFDYETASMYYLKALKIAENKNIEQAKYVLFNNIAKIKEHIGKHDEALSLYKKNFAYEILHKDTIGSIETTLNIAESMRNLKKHDSASYYYHSIVDRIYKEFPHYKGFLTIGEGINLFYKKNYIEAEQLLQKGSSEIDFIDLGNRQTYILGKLYLGKIQLTHYNDTEKAKEYFTEVDSLVSKAKAVIPETIGAYEFLINYYDERGNIEEQLDVVSKLYELRTTISSRKINTVEMLHSEFDTPELLKSKEMLIQKLENKTNSLNTRTIYLIVFIVLLLTLSVVQYNKHRKYKKRFNAIISELNTKKTKNISHNNLSITPQLASIIDEATVTAIVKKLDYFETKKEFLEKDLNLATVAKKCDTNAKYLSKIINAYKDQSFVNYINNLRVDYILKELKENTILQKYTIKSISEEAGFNTAESFATAFKKRTGIRPSYYIRNLKS